MVHFAHILPTSPCQSPPSSPECVMQRSVALFAAVLLAVAARAADPQPPKAFTPLFNGNDLTGWHGWAIHDKDAGPYDLAKLTVNEVVTRGVKWTDDSRKHWRVENGELVND